MKDTEVQSAIELLRVMMEWAQETGFHESGYDPVDTVDKALYDLHKEVDRLQALVLERINHGRIRCDTHSGTSTF